ncbi:MAG: hypothetical protein GX875_02565 [Propionibacterium sp.]|nr:hypothetical protein [Propionibacterium sp.]
MEHHSSAHDEAQPAALVEIARGSRASAWLVSIFGWDRSRAPTGADVSFNDRRGVRLADVVKTSSNRLGFTVIIVAALGQWAICTNIDEALGLAGHERCGSRSLDRFSTT